MILAKVALLGVLLNQQVAFVPEYIYIRYSRDQTPPISLPDLSKEQLEEICKTRNLHHVVKDGVYYIFTNEVWNRVNVQELTEVVKELANIPSGQGSDLSSLSPQSSEMLKTALENSFFGADITHYFKEKTIRFQVSSMIKLECEIEGKVESTYVQVSDLMNDPSLFDLPVHVAPLPTEQSSAKTINSKEVPKNLEFIPRPSRLSASDQARKNAVASEILAAHYQSQEDEFYAFLMSIDQTFLQSVTDLQPLLSGESTDSSALSPRLLTRIRIELGKDQLPTNFAVKMTRNVPTLNMQVPPRDGVGRSSLRLGFETIFGVSPPAKKLPN